MAPVQNMVPDSSTDVKSQPGPKNVSYIAIPKSSPPETVQMSQYSDQGLTFNQSNVGVHVDSVRVSQNQNSPQQQVQVQTRQEVLNDPIGDLFPVTSQGKR